MSKPSACPQAKTDSRLPRPAFVITHHHICRIPASPNPTQKPEWKYSEIKTILGNLCHAASAEPLLRILFLDRHLWLARRAPGRGEVGRDLDRCSPHGPRPTSYHLGWPIKKPLVIYSSLSSLLCRAWTSVLGTIAHDSYKQWRS